MYLVSIYILYQPLIRTKLDMREDMGSRGRTIHPSFTWRVWGPYNEATVWRSWEAEKKGKEGAGTEQR